MLQSRAVARKTSRAILSSAKCGFFNNRVQRKSLGPFSCSGPGVLTKLVLIHMYLNLQAQAQAQSPKSEARVFRHLFRFSYSHPRRSSSLASPTSSRPFSSANKRADLRPTSMHLRPFRVSTKKIIIFSSCSRSFLALGTSNRVVGQSGAPNKPVLPTGPPLQGTRKRGKEGRKKKGSVKTESTLRPVSSTSSNDSECAAPPQANAL